MKGTRLYKEEGEPDFLFRISEIPGAYGTANGKDWFATTPNGLLGNLGNHSVTENADGTITVSPSIEVTAGPLGYWHGFLKSGIWTSC